MISGEQSWALRHWFEAAAMMQDALQHMRKLSATSKLNEATPVTIRGKLTMSAADHDAKGSLLSCSIHGCGPRAWQQTSRSTAWYCSACVS